MQPGKSIVELTPDWGSSATPEQQGILPGSHWEISAWQWSAGWTLDVILHRGLYGIAANNPALVDVLLSNAKAIHRLHETYFVHSTIDKLNPENYTYRYVFTDWLSIGLAGVVLDEASETPFNAEGYF